MPDHQWLLFMTRYNAWQNDLMRQALEALPPKVVSSDRGAFFGSMLGTVNHILWADQMWMSRFAGWPKPECGLDQSPELTRSVGAWSAERSRLDGHLSDWAAGVDHVALSGELRWVSGATGAQMSRPMSLCVAHMFNHQAHHRGQVHSMVTGAGAKGWLSDLAFLPELST
ncbi:damage-inducible protein DinB [Salipiger pallidus]|uniref:Damage-inducible protein DinB n=1 Tax=Salipiger pallidus TaxID=1775170 RepID=A0A8J2ZG59_9RHOB|nr:DinB family protein [Salipiger pallidus]GGG59197.1 damage-inducible protein DinB [Salipiger pallidus]